MVVSSAKSFNILDFTNQLTQTKQKNRYICPVCGKENLTINPESGKYQCWGGCECKAIREAVSPWSGMKKQESGHKLQKQKPPIPAPIPEGILELARLEHPVVHPAKRKRGNQIEIEYRYSNTQWVRRTEKPADNAKGYEKITIPYHLNEEGEPTKGKGKAAWNPYRLDEVYAYGTGKWVLGVEGEPCTEAGREIELVTFTFSGSGWSEPELTRVALLIKAAGVAGVIYLPDHDPTGYKKAAVFAAAAAKAQLPFIQLDPLALWSECPEKGDIADWVKWGMEQGWNKEEFVMRLEEQFAASVEKEREEGHDKGDDLSFEQELFVNNFIDFDYFVDTTLDTHLFKTLFDSDQGNTKVIDQTFHKYVEGHGYWKKVEDKIIYKQISHESMKCFQLVKGKMKYNLGTNSHVKSAFQFNRLALEAETQPYSKHLRAFSNCAVDMRTGESFPHSPDHLITVPIAAEYIPNQACPDVFLDFIKSAYGHDLVDVIRALTSMFLDPTALYGYFVHLIGQSGSGKGTLLRLWGEMFGIDHFRSGQFSDLATAEGRHQHLTGVSLFAVPDVGGRLEGLKAFYELVDNGPMSGRALFSPNGYQKQWDTRFVVGSVNHLSQENSGDGWDRRCCPLATKPREGDIDEKLGTKLAEVKGAVISWALGMDKSERDRTIKSYTRTNERIALLKQEASIHGDPVRSFIDRCLVPTDEKVEMRGDHLHSLYKAFCEAHSHSAMGYQRMISHLSTVLPKNYVKRRRCTKAEAKALGLKPRDIIPSYWQNLQVVPGAFVNLNDENNESNGYQGKSSGSDPVWRCQKSYCSEGGLDAIAHFWNPEEETPPDGTPPTPTDLDQPFSVDQPCSEQNQTSLIQKNPSENKASRILDQLDRLDQPSKVTHRENLFNSNVEVEVGGETIKGREVIGDPADPTDPKSGTLDLQGKNLDRPPEKMADPNQGSGKMGDPKSESDPHPPENDPLSEESVTMMAADLAMTDSRETMEAIRGIYPPETLIAACKLLSPEQHKKIKKWVLELNEIEFRDHSGKQLAVGDTVDHVSPTASLKGGVIKTMQWQAVRYGFNPMVRTKETK